MVIVNDNIEKSIIDYAILLSKMSVDELCKEYMAFLTGDKKNLKHEMAKRFFKNGLIKIKN